MEAAHVGVSVLIVPFWDWCKGTPKGKTTVFGGFCVLGQADVGSFPRFLFVCRFSEQIRIKLIGKHWSYCRWTKACTT